MSTTTEISLLRKLNQKVNAMAEVSDGMVSVLNRMYEAGMITDADFTTIREMYSSGLDHIRTALLLSIHRR
jgi:hypothetical protein